MTKTFDIAIPVYHPGKVFFELIRRICQQERLPQRLILMNTESEKCSFSDLRRKVEAVIKKENSTLRKGDQKDAFPFELVVASTEKKDFDHGGTRHLLSTYAKSDCLLFFTQDALPKNRYLTKELLACHENSKAGEIAVAYGRQMARKQAGDEERWTREFNYPKTSRRKSKKDLPALGIKTFFCSDVCAMYDLSIYRKLGGFERKTIFNEDMLFAGKAILQGYSIDYCASAVVLHSHQYTFFEEFRRNFDLGVSQKQHPEVFAFVSSSKEGVRLVEEISKKLLAKGELLEWISFLFRCCFKYFGYFFGKHYEKLPLGYRKKISMNPIYWEKKETLGKTTESRSLTLDS